MLNALLTRVVGSKNERDLRGLQDQVDAVLALEPEFERLSDADLRARTEEFRRRVAAGAPVEDLLVEAFAAVREAGKRALGMRIFPVQVLGGIVLHQGRIAEMKTGEGKTLVATMPAYLNALTGRGVHIITVNDYLARRDATWMGPVYELLGVSVGVIQHDMDDAARQAAYRADVTYGTNNEFGFDYLRDNMKFALEAMVQRGHHYGIVDEVDSILIDEARTPLIISGPVEHSDQEIYRDLIPVVKTLRARQSGLIREVLDRAERAVEEHGANLPDEAMEDLLLVKRGDPKNRRYLDILARQPALKGKASTLQAYYSSQKLLHDVDEKLYCHIDERSNLVDFSEMGREVLSAGQTEAFVIPDLSEEFDGIDRDPGLPPEEKIRRKQELERLHFERSERNHAVRQLVKAFWLFEKDVHYVVKDGQVVIVDEFTGRLMPGRRWSDGLHQAVEAKENVRIERENQTLATITFQNYFRMYGKLAGMTGTADTEAAEFDKIYKLDVVVVPTNRPLRRTEHPDVVYRTQEEKYRAVVNEIGELHEKGQPVLVGTISIENSERLSRQLKREAVPHVVLNAKYHEKEAEIVARAGQKGAVTIATNMAGRGTDIVLGPGVKELGGVHILGTERHEARRIDNQLRGRSGRQGDPGSSRFYLSLEDDLMRIFGSDRISGIMQRLGMEEDVPIIHPMVTRSIERAQKQVEAHNFEIRKHLLDYDDVMNKQRNEIYRLRRELLEGKGQREYILEKARDIVDWLLEAHAPEAEDPGDWKLPRLWQELFRYFGVDLRRLEEAVRRDGMGRDALGEEIRQAVIRRYAEKEERIGEELLRRQERLVLLHVIDTEWKDHLLAMDHLREGIGLRGYGQRDPLVEYKKESFEMFGQMKERIEDNVLRYLFHFEPGAEQRRREEEIRRRREQRLFYGAQAGADKAGPAQPVKRDAPKVGRNDPCPCGSGRKYKKCHGQ